MLTPLATRRVVTRCLVPAHRCYGIFIGACSALTHANNYGIPAMQLTLQGLPERCYSFSLARTNVPYSTPRTPTVANYTVWAFTYCTKNAANSLKLHLQLLYCHAPETRVTSISAVQMNNPFHLSVITSQCLSFKPKG